MQSKQQFRDPAVNGGSGATARVSKRTGKLTANCARRQVNDTLDEPACLS